MTGARQHAPRAALALIALGLATAARADAPRIHAITGARIVTAPGEVIERGTIVLRDGLIESVGADVAAPPDARVIAAESGWTVYPAFIDAASSVGLDTEAPAGPARGGPEPKRLGARHELESVHPEDGIVDRLDTAHSSFGRHRAMGFALAHVLPDKGVFRGESALVVLREAPAPELVARARLAQVIALETSSFMARKYPSSKFGAVATVRQVFLDAQRHGEWSARFAADPSGMEPPAYRSSDAPVLAVLRGERPVVFVTLQGLDPGRFANLAAEFGLQRSVTVARDLGERVENLAAAGMPVLLPLELPAKPELAGDDDLVETELRDLQEALLAPRMPGLLDAAGVRLAFVTLGMKNPRSFHENLAGIVKAGFPPDKALAALTTAPAELLGLARSTGTLAPGKQANLFVVEGELFTAKPKFRHLFVEGHHEEIEPEKTVGDPNAVVDPRGTWQVVTEVMGRASESTWTITGSTDPDGSRRYAGHSESARGKRDFTSVELKGNALTVVSTGPGGDLEITVVVTGETFVGETSMTSERGSVGMKVNGRRTAGPEGDE
jgi:hypothetical protein